MKKPKMSKSRFLSHFTLVPSFPLLWLLKLPSEAVGPWSRVASIPNGKDTQRTWHVGGHSPLERQSNGATQVELCVSATSRVAIFVGKVCVMENKAKSGGSPEY